jgi:cephalosporin hydroxylase
MNPIDDFRRERERIVTALGNDKDISAASLDWMSLVNKQKYSYTFDWLGRPIIQYPQDIVAMQELIWRVRPDLIIETGIAHGGSLVFSASMLALLEFCDAAAANTTLDPAKPSRQVVAVDIDIRAHNRSAIDAHPLRNRMVLIEGSSIAPNIVSQIKKLAHGKKSVLVCLDSNHTHEHVLAELEAYADLTTTGSYCVVFDTVIEDLPDDMFADRPWGRGNSPKTAVHKFIETNKSFEIDRTIQDKLQLTVAPDGFLKRVR